MPSLTFPFCIVTSRHGDVSIPVASPGAAGYVAVFTTVEKATAYMVATGKNNWQMKLVSRPTLAPIIESLRMLGAKGFCLDPTENGNSGTIDFDAIKDTVAGSTNPAP